MICPPIIKSGELNSNAGTSKLPVNKVGLLVGPNSSRLTPNSVFLPLTVDPSKALWASVAAASGYQPPWRYTNSICIALHRRQTSHNPLPEAKLPPCNRCICLRQFYLSSKPCSWFVSASTTVKFLARICFYFYSVTIMFYIPVVGLICVFNFFLIFLVSGFLGHINFFVK